MIKKIVCISDTHGRHGSLKIPECDLLIHAGDMTANGNLEAIRSVYRWLEEQNARHVVVVPGNHEVGLEANLEEWLPILKKNILKLIHL